MHSRSSTEPTKDHDLGASQVTHPAAEENQIPLTVDGKNAAAVALGRLGGLKGGRARAERLSQEERSEIARKAAQSRWAKNKRD